MPDALEQITKVFEKFYREVSPLDMNVAKFETCIKNEIPWESKSLKINEFIHSTITENEYNNILFTCPGFETFADSQKYNILIHNIAVTSYDYMTKRSIIELSRLEIIKAFDSIVDEFINTEFLNFKNKDKEINKCK